MQRTTILCLAAEAAMLLPHLTAQSLPELAANARPPAFVANQGQWACPATFRIDAAGGTTWIDATGMTIDLHGVAPLEEGAFEGAGAGMPTTPLPATLHLAFVHAEPRPPIADDLRPGRAHFYLGNDPSTWRTNVPTYGAVRWHEPWSGISVRADAHAAGLLEFTIDAAAGVDPANAVFRWVGIDRIESGPNGALVLSTPAGPVMQSAPVAWQPTASGERLPVRATVELLADHSFCFRTDTPRPDLPVVIDPVLTFLGGSGDESGLGVAWSPSGQMLVAGSTTSAPSFGGRDVFVTCIDLTAPPAAAVVWTTTLGGAGDELAFDVAADCLGFATIVGGTFSINFPTTPSALQSAFAGGLLDGFVVQLTPSGLLLPGGFSTYFGGINNDWCSRVEIDPLLQATIAGFSDSPTLPGMGSYSPYPINQGMHDAFVMRLAPFGTAYVYATFLGGTDNEGPLPITSPTQFTPDSRELGLDVDGSGRVLIAARTRSFNFPCTPGCYQPVLAGAPDAFVSILDPSLPPATQLVYSTHLGGTASDGATAARFGRGAELVVGGYTYSATFPATASAYQPSFIGPQGFNDAFVAVLDSSLSGAAQLVYSTFLGGANSAATLHFDCCNGLLVDACGRITAVGFCCGDAQWPTTLNPVQAAHGGLRDGFAVRLDPRLTGTPSLVCATFLGGSGNDVLSDVASEPAGGILVAGHSTSPTIPLVPGAPFGGFDALCGRLDMLPALVGRGGCNSGYCSGATGSTTLVLDVDRQPIGGAPFALQIGGAPPFSLGLLGLAFGPPPASVPFLGAIVCVGPTPFLFVMISDSCGSASFTLNVPPGFPVPLSVHAQALWFAPATCALPYTSSATLQL